jgi:hypothetical protein
MLSSDAPGRCVLGTKRGHGHGHGHGHGDQGWGVSGVRALLPDPNDSIFLEARYLAILAAHSSTLTLLGFICCLQKWWSKQPR